MNLFKDLISTETLPKMALKKQLPVSIAAALLTLGAGSTNADQVFLDDVIVDGSLCVGFDCVNGESFGFDTIRIKENNLRIKADDTSSTASFPNFDWQLTFNETSNGGQNKFSVDDITSSSTPFTIEGGAPSHSLYVDDGGRIGLGTSTPVVEVHIKDGDTPTLRLEQDGSSGFTAQTWDLAGNETNFFIRDVTNGSTLPFRIRPSAPTSSIDVAGDGDVGIGTSSPGAALHVRRTNATAKLLVEESSSTEGGREMLRLKNNGPITMQLEDTSSGANDWDIINDGVQLQFSRVGTGGAEFTVTQDGGLFVGPGAAFNLALDGSGNLSIVGNLVANLGLPSQDTFPDYVFEPDYPLRSLEDLASFIQENGHLPNVPSQEEVQEQGGINMTQLQLSLLEKVEELTLYTLDQHKTISELQARLATLESEDDRQ